VAFPKLDRKTAQEAVDAVAACNGVVAHAAKALGVPWSTLNSRLRAGRELTPPVKPSAGVTPQTDAQRPVLRYDDATRMRAISLARQLGSANAAGKALGINQTTISAWLKSPALALGKWEEHPDAAILRAPAEERPIDEILRDRRAEFDRQANAHADKLIPVRIKLPGPIGILHFGDPHLDNPSCDIYAVERHVALAKATRGLFAATVGDLQDNWIGRLAMQWANSTTTGKEAWKLVEWFVTELGEKLLYLVGGNHDGWSGHGDPLEWIARQAGTHLQASEARLELHFPNGRTVRVNARHDFAGTSQWNPTHGAMKAAIMGTRDHINIAGHRHVCGYGVLKCMHQQIVMHCIQVGSYKLFDRYARDKGFRDQHISPACVTIIDPDAEREEDLVTMVWSPERGAQVLNALREGR
jgi:hypothetical protein